MTIDFRNWPDVARRELGAAVIWCNDELFAAADNLINTPPATHDRDSFGPRGKIYDGWETRRRRADGAMAVGRADGARPLALPDGAMPVGSADGARPLALPDDVADEVIVRLAVPAIVRGVVIDTAFFKGNFPQTASMQATTLLDYPSLAEVQAAEWVDLLARSELEGDTPNTFDVAGVERLSTHVRLRIYPDGGVARLRVHGEVVADPRFMGGRVDLAAAMNGGRVTGCSNLFYSSPANVLAPGRSRVMSDGWETARRRDGGNDWLTVSLAASAVLHDVVIDTSRFVGNAPGAVRLSDVETGAELLPLTRLQPDTEHRFRLRDAPAASEVRLDAYPDGGLSRLRIHGEITPAGRASVGRRWLSLLPAGVAQSMSGVALFD